MDSVLVFGLRIGLLVLLWLFILVALNAMRRDAKFAAASTAPKAASNTGFVAPAPRSRKPAAHITVIEGPLRGSHMQISSLEEFTVGRAPDCDFVVGDDYASSRHARLFRRGSEWFVEDLDSRNGTFVSGARIDQPERIAVGTDIKLGRSLLRLVP
ncbi:FHA domain-containing protein FhaB/FipA [Corynebacterium propinquum]|uniref:FHA domain-containing protein n=1 Tax=Corynebacterium propinquum TaxID=43769 RepID=A0ABT7G425_9CORY|nr:FHA domain-containing protein [Corynebacterium propinquum]MDK4301489.1 FHA domain-containing protein [Corynebacterium propinquum]MDK4314283.1 FHA domain-containing protein [Corynebacterium propinquum]WKS49932.1 FHA domain-containing protein [Corynebacterium propinquum]